MQLLFDFLNSPSAIIVLVVVIALVLLTMGAAIHALYARARRSFVVRRNASQGELGENRARSYLIKHGFTITAEQALLQPHFWLNGEKKNFVLKADFIVKRHGKKGVVEVKTGEAAAPGLRHTRRQLLEYSVLYGVQDVYLFDGTCEKLHHISFEKAIATRSMTALFVWLSGFLAGCIVVWLLVQYLHVH